MGLFSDLIGTIADAMQIGLGVGQKTLKFGDRGSLSWNPSSDRSITLPDTDGVLAMATTTVFEVTTSKTIRTDDSGSLQFCTNAGAITITIPDGSELIPSFSIIEVQRDGAGTVSFAVAPGVSLRRLGTSATTGHQIVARYTSCYLRKINDFEWRVFGAIA
jgi:hypothetical protein